MDTESNKYQRVLLKLSGESFNTEQPSCFNMEAVSLLCNTLCSITKHKIQIAVVIGGGNIWRGRDAHEHGLPQVSADMIGMTATLLNALVFQAMLEKKGISAKVLSPNPVLPLMEHHHWKKAVDYLNEGHLVIFAGGTGCPLFSTDTASALRAVEIKAQLILKATTVDHVYNDDPKKNHHAVSYDHITYEDILQQKLKVIDETAAIICNTHNIPMRIFSINDPINLIKILLKGEFIGTWVSRQIKDTPTTS